MSESPRLSRRALLTYGALGAVGLLGVGLSQLVPNVDTMPERSQPSIVATPVHEPKAPDLVKVRDALGPWTVADPASPHGHNVVMMHANGTLEEGSRELRRDANWQSVVTPSMFSYGLIDGIVRVAVSGKYFVSPRFPRQPRNHPGFNGTKVGNEKLMTGPRNKCRSDQFAQHPRYGVVY